MRRAGPLLAWHRGYAGGHGRAGLDAVALNSVSERARAWDVAVRAVVLCSRRERATGSVDLGAASRLAEAVCGDRYVVFGFGGASDSHGGLGVVLDVDGEPVVRVGGDVCGAWPVGVGGDSARLSARVGGEHLHVRADAPVHAVPAQSALDEPGPAVRPGVEPGWLWELVGGVPVGVYISAGGVVVRRGTAGGFVVRLVRRPSRGDRGDRSRPGCRSALYPQRRRDRLLRLEHPRRDEYRVRAA